MLALKAIIHNYRSIQEECTLNIDPLVTTLVGATESGKSNILKALASFTSGAYSEDDFCSQSAERSTLDPNARMVTVEFRIEDHERDALASIHPPLEHADTLTVTRFYGGHCEIAELPKEAGPANANTAYGRLSSILARIGQLVADYCSERGISDASFASAVNDFEQAMRRAVEDADESLWQSLTGNRLSSIIDQAVILMPEGEEIYREYLKPLLEDIPSLVGEGLPLVPSYEKITDAVVARLSRFTYIPAEHADFLHGRYPLSELEAMGTPPEPRLQTVSQLLSLGGITVADLLQADIGQRYRMLQRAGQQITNALRGVWSQGRGEHDLAPVSISLSVDEEELRIFITTEGGHSGWPEERSLGFQWYLTFYLSYALAVLALGRQTVLLFDEPAIHLHPQGQRDLLARLNQMAEHTQVIQATHLPDLVDLDRPSSWRLVRFVAPKGTITDNEAYKTPKGRIGAEVICKALGVLARPPWPRTLVVEGPADPPILDTVSRLLGQRDEKYACLAKGDVYVLVAHGLSKYQAVISVSRMPDYKLVALFDSDKAGNAMRKHLLAEHTLEQEEAVSINDVYSSTDPRELEDLLGFELYQKAVLRAYRNRLPDGFSLQRSGLPKDGGLANQVKAFFNERPDILAPEGFDKWCVSLAVRDILVEDPAALPEDHLERFARLFDLIIGKLY